MSVKWASLDYTEQTRLAALYKSGQPLQEEARKYGMQRKTLERRCQEFIYYQRLFLNNFQLPEYSERVYNEYTVLQADDAIIISDLEIPDVDPLMLKRYNKPVDEFAFLLQRLAPKLSATLEAGCTMSAYQTLKYRESQSNHDSRKYNSADRCKTQGATIAKLSTGLHGPHVPLLLRARARQ